MAKQRIRITASRTFGGHEGQLSFANLIPVVSGAVAFGTFLDFCFATKEEKMTQIFKKSLLMAALVAAFAVAQAGSTMAQVNLLDTEEGPGLGTRLFEGATGTVADIPAATAGDGFAEAYYDPATGDVLVSFGSEVILIGVNGEPVLGENLTSDLGLFGQLPLASGSTGQNDDSGVGFLRTGGLVQGFDPALGPIAVASNGPINLGALLPAGLTTPEAFNAAFNQTDDAAIVFFSVGVNEGIDGNDGVQGFQILSQQVVDDPGEPGPVVPEPGSASLLALVAMGFAARRRK